MLIFIGLPVAELIAGLVLLIIAFRRSSGSTSPTAEPFDQAEKLASSEPFALAGAALVIAAIIALRGRGNFIVAQVLVLMLLSFLIPALLKV